MEFRTESPASESDGESGGFLDDTLEELWENLQNNPQAQAQIAKGLSEEYGVDPSLLASIFPGVQGSAGETVNGDEPAQEPRESRGELPAGDTDAQKVTTELRKPTPEEVMGFLDEVIDYGGKDMTLEELQTFGKQNPDIIETAINLKF